MSRLRTPTALAALATVALAGCGGSHPKPPAHDATRGMAPLAAVEQGFAKLRARPSRMDLSMDIAYDTGGLSSELKRAFAGRAVHAKESMEIVNERRAKATMDVGPVHGGKVVLYDGTVFFSTDGHEFKQVTGQLGQLFSGLGAMSRQLSGKSFAGMRYVGFEGDGKHYTGKLSAAAKQGMESLTAANGAPGTTQRSSHVEVWIDPATGLVAREQSKVEAAMDLSKIGVPGAEGTLVMKLSSDIKIHDVGKPVVVQRPRSTGTATSWADLLG